MTLKQLHVFIAVAETRSFTKAGERVSLAQSTASQHIRALEEELGVRLLERSTSLVSLTPVGRLFYEHAISIIHRCDESVTAVRRFQGLEEAIVRVGASTIPAACLIPDMIGRLMADFPGIRLEVRQGDSQQALRMLIDDEVELAVVGTYPGLDTVSAQVVMTDRILLSARPDVAQSRAISLQQLATCPLVMREAGSGTRQATDAALRHAGFDPKRLTITAQVGSSEAQRRAVLHGNCFAFISSLAIEPELSSGALVEILIDGLSIQRDFYLTWRSGHTLSPAASKLAGLLTQHVDSSCQGDCLP